MTTGIYSLHWEDQDLIYIGQSQNIEVRFKEHLYKLKHNTHTNYKVQDAFNSFGVPTTSILEECGINQLNDLEIFWQKEFNSLNSLDLIEAGQVGYGVNSNGSKYTKLQILLVFKQLYKSNNTYNQISIITNTKESLVQDISGSRTHIWLKEKYPKLYSKMKSKRISTNNKNCINRMGKSKEIISPDGIKYLITNIKRFALDNNLDSAHLGKVLNGKYLQHKGWKLPS